MQWTIEDEVILKMNGYRMMLAAFEEGNRIAKCIEIGAMGCVIDRPARGFEGSEQAVEANSGRPGESLPSSGSLQGGAGGGG